MQTAASTHTGNVRAMNQDAFLIFKKKNTDVLVAAVADGMGGHRAGDMASKLALSSVRDFCDENHEMDEQELSISAVDAANTAVYTRAQEDEDCYGMGTTLCMVQVHEDRFTYAHVGDSRIYRFSEEHGLCRVTRDHSLVQELLDEGRIDEKEAAMHPQRNIITRAVGTSQTVLTDVETLPFAQGETLLLCSDGLSGEVDDETLEKILQEYPDINDAITVLVQAALDARGRDNITALLVQNTHEVNA